MYHYIYGPYIAYKLYEYSCVAEHIYTAGEKLKRVYDYVVTDVKIKDDSRPYQDWVMIDVENDPDMLLIK